MAVKRGHPPHPPERVTDDSALASPPFLPPATCHLPPSPTMRRAKLLQLLTPLLLAAGLSALTAAAVAPGGSSVGGRSAGLVGAALVFLGGGAGLLANVGWRRGCRALATESRGMASAGEIHPLDAPDTELQPLVAAVNECLAVAQSAMAGDRSRRRELEIQLKVAHAERRHAEAVIGSISDAVIVTDPYDDVVLANDAAARTLGFPAGAVGGAGVAGALADRRPVGELVRDAALVSLIREMRQSRAGRGPRVVEHEMRQGQAVRNFKVTLARVGEGEEVGSGKSEVGSGSGARPALPTSGFPLPASQQDSGVVAVLRDTTWEKEVARAKSDFVSHVSHELRTPLASIRAYVEMLIDGDADDEKTRREFHEVIQTEADRLGRLIDDILNISRIESGLAKIDRRPVSPVVLMKEAVGVIGPQAKAKEIAIEDNLGASLHQVVADRDMLYQAILNLLSNAVKYTPAGGRVRVTLTADESRRVVVGRVEDNGAGIPEKDLPRVFEKFYRVEANNKLAKGTGLGLPLVKQIIETVHRGKIIAESTVGVGSTFGFELPMAE